MRLYPCGQRLLGQLSGCGSTNRDHSLSLICPKLVSVRLKKYINGYQGNAFVAIRKTVVPRKSESIGSGKLGNGTVRSVRKAVTRSSQR